MLLRNKIKKQINKYNNLYFVNKQENLERRAKGQSRKFVLMFHQVVDNMSDAYNPDYTISTATFVSLVNRTFEATKFITIDDLLDDNVDEGVYITFDDAFAGVYTKAFPLLKEKKIDFAVFQAIEKMDKELWLTRKQLLELDKHPGCTVGSHTISHPHLRCLKRHESKMEIIGGGLLLSDILGRNVDVMAFPYGSCCDVGKREICWAKKEYLMAFSTIQSCVPKRANRFFIPRLNVCEANAEEILQIVCSKK